jgi:hypothetical protein
MYPDSFRTMQHVQIYQTNSGRKYKNQKTTTTKQDKLTSKMLTRTVLPMAKAMPVATRLIVIRSNYTLARRAFHISYVRPHDTKATFATIAPEVSKSTAQAAPTATAGETVTKAEAKPLMADIEEKRDFHWSHPVYTKEEYEAVKVIQNHMVLHRSHTVRRVHSLNMSPWQPSNSSAQVSISSQAINILQVHAESHF